MGADDAAEPDDHVGDDAAAELGDAAADPAAHVGDADPVSPSEAEGRVDGRGSHDSTVLDSPDADSFDTSQDGTLS
jgi:hypothetical protein